MKTCDVCKRDDRHGPNGLEEGYISTVHAGTDIGIATVGDQCERSIAIELCSACNEKVNASISEHLLEKFGIRIRPGPVIPRCVGLPPAEASTDVHTDSDDQ